jgi:hypothetical protein
VRHPALDERWSRPLLAVWNVNLVVAMALLLAGWNRGWELGELPPRQRAGDPRRDARVDRADAG